MEVGSHERNCNLAAAGVSAASVATHNVCLYKLAAMLWQQGTPSYPRIDGLSALMAGYGALGKDIDIAIHLVPSY